MREPLTDTQKALFQPMASTLRGLEEGKYGSTSFHPKLKKELSLLAKVTERVVLNNELGIELEREIKRRLLLLHRSLLILEHNTEAAVIHTILGFVWGK